MKSQLTYLICLFCWPCKKPYQTSHCLPGKNPSYLPPLFARCGAISDHIWQQPFASLIVISLIIRLCQIRSHIWLPMTIIHVTNEEVRRKIQAAIGEYDELLTLVKKRKLRWFGHVSRSSGLAKTILQGTVKGKRKRGRQKKRWEDNIKEWTRMDFASSTRAAENRSRWKGIVAN